MVLLPNAIGVVVLPFVKQLRQALLLLDVLELSHFLKALVDDVFDASDGVKKFLLELGRDKRLELVLNC